MQTKTQLALGILKQLAPYLIVGAVILVLTNFTTGSGKLTITIGEPAVESE